MTAYFAAFGEVVGDPRDTAYQKLLQWQANSGSIATVERSGNYKSDGTLNDAILTTNNNYVAGFFQNCESINFYIGSQTKLIPAWTAINFSNPEFTPTPNMNGQGTGKLDIVGHFISQINFKNVFDEIDYDDNDLLFCIPAVQLVLMNYQITNQIYEFVYPNWLTDKFNGLGSGFRRETRVTNVIQHENAISGYLPTEYDQTGTVIIDYSSVQAGIGVSKTEAYWTSSSRILNQNSWANLYPQILNFGVIPIDEYISGLLHYEYPVFAFYQVTLWIIKVNSE